MGLINLTREYHQSGKSSILEKIRDYFLLEIYWAENLKSIEDGFREEPPVKSRFLDSEKEAIVLIYDLEVKRFSEDSFDEEDEVSVEIGLDANHCSPIFELKDKTMIRLAYWSAGDSKEYLFQQKQFGFNKDNFVVIPRTILIYRNSCKYNRGFLSINDFTNPYYEQPEKNRSGNRIKNLASHLKQLLAEESFKPLSVT